MYLREDDRLILQSASEASIIGDDEHLTLISKVGTNGFMQQFPVNNPIPDEIIVNEGVSGRWMSIPISHEEVETMRRLPKSAKEDFKKNVHEYIGQLGKDHKPLTAMPLDEAPYALG